MRALGLGLALLVCAAFAQESPPPVEQPPPPTTFQEWQPGLDGELYREYLVRFPSALESPYEVNNVVPLRVYVPNDATGPRPVVLITHYWGATDLRAETALATELCRQGIAAAVLTLPYHLERTPRGTRSGQLAVTANPADLTRTMTQAVLDIRRALDFLDSRPEFTKTPRGLAGTSLGAIVGSLAYAVDPRISHVALLVGGVDLAKVLWESSKVVQQRDVLRRRGYTEGRLRQELKSIEPAERLPRAVPGAALVVIGKFDTVIPGGSSQLLVQKLPGARVLRLDTGHYGGVFVQRRLIRETAAFFRQEFGGQGYVAPLRLYAPTIRLGATLDNAARLEVGGGLDVWRFDPRGDFVGTVFLTPRSLNFWITGQISQGLSLGVYAGTRRVGFGVMWSTVL